MQRFFHRNLHVSHLNKHVKESFPQLANTAASHSISTLACFNSPNYFLFFLLILKCFSKSLWNVWIFYNIFDFSCPILQTIFYSFYLLVLWPIKISLVKLRWQVWWNYRLSPTAGRYFEPLFYIKFFTCKLRCYTFCLLNWHHDNSIF